MDSDESSLSSFDSGLYATTTRTYVGWDRPHSMLFYEVEGINSSVARLSQGWRQEERLRQEKQVKRRFRKLVFLYLYKRALYKYTVKNSVLRLTNIDEDVHNLIVNYIV